MVNGKNIKASSRRPRPAPSLPFRCQTQHDAQESDTADPGNEDPDNQDPDTADPDNQDPGDEDLGNEDPDNRDPDNQDSATEDLEAASGDMEMGGGADRKKGKGRPESKGGQVVRIRKTTPNLRDLDNAAGESGLLA